MEDSWYMNPDTGGSPYSELDVCQNNVAMGSDGAFQKAFEDGHVSVIHRVRPVDSLLI